MKAITSIEGLIPQLAIMYHVKIGKKGEERKARGGGKWRLPQKLDHFRITHIERGEDTNFIEVEDFTKKLKDEHGDKPRELEIIFMYNEIHLNFPHRYSCYATKDALKKKKITSKTKRCYCQGNGRIAERLSPEGYKEEECNPETCEMYQQKDNDFKCKIFGRLLFLVPGLTKLGECADFATTSAKTVRQILGSLQLIQMKTRQMMPGSKGVLAGIPLKLIMYKATDEAETGTVTNWKVMVKYDGTEEALAGSVTKLITDQTKYINDIKQIEAQVEETVGVIELHDEDNDQEEYFPQDTEPDYSDVPDDILKEVSELCDKLEYNEAKFHMFMGEHKGSEADLVKELKAQVEKLNSPAEKKEKKKSEAKEEKEPPKKTVKKEENKDKDKKGLLDGAEPLASDHHPADTSKVDERDELIAKIKECKKKLSADDFNGVRAKYNMQVSSLSIQELKDLVYDLEGKLLGAGEK